MPLGRAPIEHRPGASDGTDGEVEWRTREHIVRFQYTICVGAHVGETAEVPIIDTFHVAAAHGQTERADSARFAAVGVVDARRQTAESDIGPGRADHEIRNGRSVSLDRIA